MRKRPVLEARIDGVFVWRVRNGVEPMIGDLEVVRASREDIVSCTGVNFGKAFAICGEITIP